jgi:polyferredoxin
MFGICSPVFHCYACPLAAFACPIGVLAQFSALHTIPFIALGTLGVVGATVGGFVCGWACPFGLLQDLASRISPARFQLPAWSGYIRYFVLAGLVIAVPWFLGEGHPLFFCRLCPAAVLEVSLPGAIQARLAGQSFIWPNAIKIGVTLAVAGSMFFIRRPWCRVLCPLGAIFGLFSRFSMFTVRFYPGRCRQCGLCPPACAYGVDSAVRADDPRCIRCLECVRCNACHVEPAWKSPEQLKNTL